MRSSILQAPAVLCVTSVAWAASPAHGEHHAPSIGTLLFPLINFSIFAFILWRFAWPAVRATLVERRRRVEAEVDEADHAHRAASQALEEIAALRARREEDAAAMIADARAEAERHAATVIDAARRGAERIRTDAALIARQEEERAAKGIRAAVAAHVVERATALVRERFGEDDQKRSVSDFLAGISAGGAA